MTHLMAALRRAPAHVLRAPRVLAACCQWALAAVEQSIRCRALNMMSNVLDTVASRAGSRLLPTDRSSAAPRGVRVPWHVMLRVALMYPIWMVASDPHFRLCLRRVRECDVERRPRGRAHSVCVPRRGQWHCGGMPKMLVSKVGFRHDSILSCGREGVNARDQLYRPLSGRPLGKVGSRPKDGTPMSPDAQIIFADIPVTHSPTLAVLRAAQCAVEGCEFAQKLGVP